MITLELNRKHLST